MIGDKNNTYIPFTNYIDIENVKYNYKNNDEMLRTRLFFQGKSDFLVLISKNRIPRKTDKAFPTCKKETYF